MAFKPNYNQQRAERNRAKQAKKEEKQREREAEVARRKAGGLPPLADEPLASDILEESVELNEGGHDGSAAA